MADEVTIRDARLDEAAFAAQMTRKMVLDMQGYGGYPAATSSIAWDKIAERISEDLKREAVKYLFAETAAGERVGHAAARLVTLEGAFEPKKTLHISVVYVLPNNRNAGVGRNLVQKLLDWGRTNGAECCTLNVLKENPAKSLYRNLGFSDIEIRMTKRL